MNFFIAMSQVDEWLYNANPQNYAAGWVDAFAQYSSDFQQAAVGTPGIGGVGCLDPPSAMIRRAGRMQTRCGPGDASITEQAELHDVQLAGGPANNGNRTVGCGTVIAAGEPYMQYTGHCLTGGCTLCIECWRDGHQDDGTSFRHYNGSGTARHRGIQWTLRRWNLWTQDHCPLLTITHTYKWLGLLCTAQFRGP